MQNNNKIRFCSRTHKGKIRSENQDFLAIDESLSLAVIADGIGGKDYGEVASQLAVEACMQYIQDQGTDILKSKGSRELANAIKLANETIITIQRNEPKYQNMGTTLSCFWLHQDHVHFAWVGDSRVYLLSLEEQSIRMLSNDHTLDQSKIDKELSPDLYKRASSILTQRIGSILLLKPDFGYAHTNPGDIILACTDGLSDRVPNDLMLEYAQNVINDTHNSLATYADKLLDRALDCGGQDNISFILART
ncbi:MAG: protein phosphatase 2C domain-containing protein [Acidiferrobacterales bacterium]|nr:protein phosphatase 2C domain-containing protein [Acidiferrobacterales bacterium]